MTPRRDAKGRRLRPVGRPGRLSIFLILVSLFFGEAGGAQVLPSPIFIGGNITTYGGTINGLPATPDNGPPRQAPGRTPFLPSLSLFRVQTAWPAGTNQWITYGNGIFLAVATASPTASVTVTSPDGVDWTTHTPLTNAALLPFVAGLAGGGGNFVAIGSSSYDSTNLFAQASADGDTWGPPVALPSFKTTVYSKYSLIYADGRYIAVGQSAEATGVVLQSADGAQWSRVELAASGPLNGVASGGRRLVAVGRWGTISVSSNGVDWSTQVVLPGTNIIAVIYGPGEFFTAAKMLGLGSIMTSTNGTDWTKFEGPQGYPGDSFPISLYDLAYADGLFVNVAGGLSVSADGLVWANLLEAGVFCNCTLVVDVAYGAGTFVALGYSDRRIDSPSPPFVLSPKYALGGCRAPGGAFALTITGGGTGQVARLQGATSLSVTDWVDLLSFTNSGGTNFSDGQATHYPQRFYRVVWP